MKSKSNSPILAVVPVYQPNIALLEQSLEKLKQCGLDILLICNSSIDPRSKREWSAFALLVDQPQNRGTAGAYNIAIDAILASACYTHLLLMDQDTILSDQYLDFCKSIEIYFPSSMLDRLVFCPFDMKNIYSPNSSVVTGVASGSLDCKLTLIKDAKASGMLIPRGVLKSLRFNQLLFVDYVDWEFCWRARRRGFALVQVDDNNLTRHHLGDTYHLRFLGLRLSLPSRTRRKMQIRSAVVILRNPTNYYIAPKRRIAAIFARFFINPMIDVLEMTSFIRPCI